MITFEFWRNRETGEILAVKLLDGIVVGCAGPLHHDDVDPEFLEDLDYASEGADRVEETRELFAPLAGP